MCSDVWQFVGRKWMTIIKSLAVGNGDLFYIRHNSDNFTIIDCNITNEQRYEIINDLRDAAQNKGIQRFISTHPDVDHIRGLEYIDDAGLGWNFYCVQNKVSKDDGTDSFKRYKKLRDDSERSYYIFRGCSRKWMNESSDEHGSAGISILWPDTSNDVFKKQLEIAELGGNTNNICPIIKYALENGVVAIWMGDLEAEVMEQIIDDVVLPKADILFAPHHGRKSGHVPKQWLDSIDPKIVVVGEAPSDDLSYYNDRNTITQNSAGDIEFECTEGAVHVRVSSPTYEVDYLAKRWQASRDDANGKPLRYIGSFDTHCQP